MSTLRSSVLGESEDFAGNRETWKIVQETWSNEVKVFLLLSPKCSGRYPRFLGGLFFTHGFTVSVC